MKITDFSVRRPVTICMIVLCVILLGGVSLTRLSVDLFPDIKFPIAVAITEYPGAGPQEVESTVTKPLEEILGTVQNVDKIQSTTSAGSSTVVVWFKWGTDMDFATLQMREKVDLIKSFLPDEVSTPMVVKMDPSMMPVVQLGLSGGKDLADLKEVAEDIKPKLERLEGVASVAITGGYNREIQVIADPVKLEAYGIGLAQISQALKTENMNISSGIVTEGNKELYVRTMGEYTSLDDIKKVHIPLPGGGTVFLRDVAEVKDTSSEERQITRMNGEPSVGVHILKQSKANTVKVSDAVNKELQKISQEIPGGIQVAPVFDQAKFIKQSIGRVAQNAWIGGVLAVIVLFLFLRNFRSTLIIGIAIPIAIIGTFTLLYLNGLTLNMMSLGGLALGIGMMVDSSIVILENIFRYREEGHSRVEAAINGADEVATAVMASTLTSIAVFLPIVYVEGMAAQLFKELALTVSFALGASLLVALTLVPMLSSKLLVVTNGLNGNGKNSILKKASQSVAGFLSWLDRVYGRILVWALGHRKTVVAGVFLILAGSFALVPLVGMEFIPSMDSGELAINVELDKGTVLEETNKVTGEIESVLGEIKEVETIFASVGAQGNQMGPQNATPEVAQIMVVLVPKTQRTRSSDEIADDIRVKLKGISGADIQVSASDGGGSPSSGSPVSISIQGDELDVLKEVAEEVVDIVKEVPGTREVESSFTEGRPEMRLIVNRDKASIYGLSVAQVASAVRTAFEGDVATRYRTGGDEVDVRVILPENYRKNLQDLKSVVLTSPVGIQVPLGDIARLIMETGPTQIDRENQSRVATVNSQISGRDLKSVVRDIQKELKDYPLPKGYSIKYGGANQDMVEAFGSLGFALILAVILVYMVMASQFESLVHPFIIMFSMPTTFIGVVAGLVITGRTFSVPTFIGVIMLAGIVVNNAIVLVDYINTLRRRGLERKEAITKAGPVRLRPILMTTLTTVLGMLPIAIGLGEGAEAQAPMATAVIGGLMASTVFTLVFVPVVYTIVDDLGQWLKRILRIGSKQKQVKGEAGS